MSTGFHKPNRLQYEKSLYLLQHANNPVEWFPWGEEAFETARRLDKPIFLSIGYSTCHWCHVMEHECFEDEEVAGLLNSCCVSIKVDREELPQVDSTYMQAAQLLSSGPLGWPLNLFLDHEKRPFFAATYLPKYSRDGLLGFMQALKNLHALWTGPQRSSLIDQASKVHQGQILISKSAPSADERLLQERVRLIVDLYFKIADPLHGGIIGAPKFPLSYQLLFLLDYGLLAREERAMFFVAKTLKNMTSGGMWDRLAGGFCRYSVDDAWTVPHFEKMLYDNALLALTYSRASTALQNDGYGQIAQKTFGYLLEIMQDPKGGFYAAQDADTQGIEGLTYTWTPHEIKLVLGDEEGVRACEYFGVAEWGLCDDGDRSPLQEGDIASLSSKWGMSEEVVSQLVFEWEQKLLKARLGRPQPVIDQKCVVAWNGLAIWAFAEGYLHTQNNQYLAAANRAADRIYDSFEKADNWLARVVDGNPMTCPSIVDDYAFLIRGLLALFQATGESVWLERICYLQKLQNELYATPAGYTQFRSGDVGLENACVALSDGAEPSANGLSLFNLHILATLTTSSKYEAMRRIVVERYAQHSKKAPLSCCVALWSTLVCSPDTLQLLVIIAESHNEKLHYLRLLSRSYKPKEFQLVVEKSQLKNLKFLIPTLGFVAQYPALLYCSGNSCSEPIYGMMAISAYLVGR